MLLMKEGVLRNERPQAVYHDRHSIFVFVPTPRRMVDWSVDWSIEEQLRGEQEPTQFGRMLRELEITQIAARSPQAKGRKVGWRGCSAQSRIAEQVGD
jgi:hypothetical protein